MRQEAYVLGNRAITVFSDEDPKAVLLQPADDNDLELMQSEVNALKEQCSYPIVLCFFKVNDWNSELTPWPAPAVFGKRDFGDRAEATLHEIQDAVIPDLQKRYDLSGDIPCIIGGYSLAGFFCLYACTRTSLFKGCAAASPSVWYPAWIEYLKKHPMLADAVYLSLGDREERTKNEQMKTVGERIRTTDEMLKKQMKEGQCVLEWNQGNHFRDSDLRTAKGFAWTVNHVCKE